MKDWFNARYEETNGKGAPKNINTMAVMYALACMVEDGTFDTEAEKQKWTAWLDEWAEWVMHGLPRTYWHVVTIIEAKHNYRIAQGPRKVDFNISYITT